ncbi:MAG: SCO family protein [Phycisphaerae bacterium]
MKSTGRIKQVRLLAGIVIAMLAGFARADVPVDFIPDEQRDVGVTQNLGAQIPLDLDFVDSDGKRVRLKEYFDGSRPVIITLNYFTCPMLCKLQLQDMVKTLQETKLDPAQDFAILTVSFDLLDQPQLAKAQREKYLSLYGHENGKKGWFFLTGKESSIKTLTETVGFQYKWNKNTEEYSHSAVMVLCMPDGKVSRYLGLNTEPDVLRLSLVEASKGKLGSVFDQLFLWCYHYDPAAGSYAAVAMNIVRLGAALVMVALAVMLTAFWMVEIRRRRARKVVAA